DDEDDEEEHANINHVEEVVNQIDVSLSEGRIKKSTSLFQHPVVMIEKLNSTHRMAMDYRSIKSLTMVNNFPLTRIKELLLSTGKAEYILNLQHMNKIQDVEEKDGRTLMNVKYHFGR